MPDHESWWGQAEMGPNPREGDRERINAGHAVPCCTCEAAFRRLRLTTRYCNLCGGGFCEGEHLTFAGPGFARCIHCGPHPVKST
jgi:hypothetical protein